jgi:hypothetical protein
MTKRSRGHLGRAHLRPGWRQEVVKLESALSRRPQRRESQVGEDRGDWALLWGLWTGIKP